MSKWTAEELETLEIELTDGVELNFLHSIFYNRSEDAVYRKCTSLGYGKQKGKDDITRLYFGKRLRTVYKKKIVGEPRTIRVVQEPTKLLESMDNLSSNIIAEKSICPLVHGLKANKEAINILQEASLIVEPNIVYQLSLHIIKCQRE